MRYQTGTIEEIQTKRGIVWFIRFTRDGKRPRFEIGTKAQYPTKAKASRAAQHIRDDFNQTVNARRTMGDLVAKYEQEEMPGRHSTGRGYRGIHRNHIVPRWGLVPLEDVTPVKVRAWLLEMEKSGKTKGNILGQMRILFKFAMLWDWLPAAVNPMSLFSIPGTTIRKRKPRVITIKQFLQLLEHFRDDTRIRTMVTAGFCNGLGASELTGLQWGDFDHHSRKVRISRGAVEGHIGPTKNQHRNAPLPLHKFVADMFLAWRHETTFKDDSDWVFPLESSGGELPEYSNNLQSHVLAPAGKEIGLEFSLGWHTLRHSYKVLLERAGIDITAQRDLMRHSDVHTTTQVYGEVEFDRMRDANEKAVDLIFVENS
jgi:integrase